MCVCMCVCVCVCVRVRACACMRCHGCSHTNIKSCENREINNDDCQLQRPYRLPKLNGYCDFIPVVIETVSHN